MDTGTLQGGSKWLYPTLLGGAMLGWFSLWRWGGVDGNLSVILVYWAFFGVLLVIERRRPFEPAWLQGDGQTARDIAWSVIAIVVNGLSAVVLLWALGWLIGRYHAAAALDVWPDDWPMPAQIVMGVLLWDLGNNLAHRAAHKVPLLWRFHALHHSAGRLSVINTGRFHPIDTVKSTLIGAPLPVLLGAPAEISLYYAALNVYTGLLTHSNIALDCGIFNQIFSTPNLHRWHHSRHQVETDTNFGEATIIWDRLFGSYFNPFRRPPRDVGIDVNVPAGFLPQFLLPFTLRGYRPGYATIPALASGEAGVDTPPVQGGFSFNRRNSRLAITRPMASVTEAKLNQKNTSP